MALFTAAAEARVLRVDPEATGGGSYKTIGAAIAAASSGDDIWVNSSTYNESVSLKMGVRVYGGFLPAHTNFGERDWGANPTIIDAQGLSKPAVYGASYGTLDGFVIQGGTGDHGQGGGLYCYSTSPTLANCTISGNSVTTEGGGCYFYSSTAKMVDCIIEDNSSASLGGGIYCQKSTPEFLRCRISGNSAVAHGAGIYCNDGGSPSILDCTVELNISADFGGGIFCSNSAPTVTNTTFRSNEAPHGAGVYCENTSNALFTSCLIENNRAYGDLPVPQRYGAGVFCYKNASPVFRECVIRMNVAPRGGGILSQSNASPAFHNCLIVGNTADTDYGGGVCCVDSAPTFFHCTLTGNVAAANGAAVRANSLSLPSLLNCVVWDNGAKSLDGPMTIRYSCVQGGFAGIGNIVEDPHFVEPWDGALANLDLQLSSPCIDWATGSPLNDEPMDFEGKPRPFDIPMRGFNGQGQGFDMGAYEYSEPTNTPTFTPTPTPVNFPPSLQAAVISPKPAQVGHDIVATGIGFFDLEGAAPDYRYRWFINGIELIGLQQDRLTPDLFRFGEFVSVVVYPFDGQVLGEPRSDSVRVTDTSFDLTVVPGSLAVLAGGRCQALVNITPRLPQNMAVALSIIAGETHSLNLSFDPQIVNLRADQSGSFSILTIEAAGTAEPDHRTLFVQGNNGFNIGAIALPLEVLGAGGKTLTLSADRIYVQVQESVLLSGALAPPVDSARIKLILSGDFSGQLETQTNAQGEYRIRVQTLETGELRVRAEAPDLGLSSLPVTVTVGKNARPNMFLATDATGQEKPDELFRVYGQLGPVVLDNAPPPVTVSIRQIGLARDTSGVLARATITEVTSALLSSSGSFSAPVKVVIEDGRVEVEADWPGDTQNQGTSAKPLVIPLGSARKDQRVLFVAGKPMAFLKENGFKPLRDFIKETMQDRGIAGDKMVCLSSLESNLQTVTAAINALQVAEELLVIVVGEGTRDGVKLGDGYVLTPQILGTIAAQIPGMSIFIIDSDHSGIFGGPLVGSTLLGSRRIFFTSSGSAQKAWFTSGGLGSFTGLFCANLRQSLNMGEAFEKVCNHFKIMGTFTGQTPQSFAVNTNSQDIVFGYAKGTETSDLLPPVVVTLDAPSSILLGQSSVVSAQVLEASGVLSVTGTFTSGTTFAVQEESFTLISGSTDTYQSPPMLFDEVGNLVVSIIAMDIAGNVSDPTAALVPVYVRPEKGDLDGNGVVDWKDLLVFQAAWTGSSSSAGYNHLADLNDDGIVDHKDLLLFVKRML